MFAIQTIRWLKVAAVNVNLKGDAINKLGQLETNSLDHQSLELNGGI